MAEAARDLSKQEQEAPRSEGEKKPELRLVTEEEAPSMIDRMVDEFEEGAESGVREAQQDGKALEDFATKQGEPLNAEEAKQNADISARAEAAADKLRTDLAAEVMPDAVATAEANMRALEAQYKGASADQKRDLERKMEAASKELDEARTAARKRSEAKAEATAPAAKKEEPKVAPDFGQLLEHLSPEAQAAAAKNFAEADEEAYGGLASKGMTPDGIVRLGYKDGTIVEVFPGGQRRSNLPEAKGAERIPELPAYLQEAEPMGPAEGEVGLITLEEDMIAEQEELLQLESGAGVPGSEARRAELRASIGKKSEQIRAKSTPEGLAKEVAAMQALIATEEADMNLAPEEERGGYATRIDQWKQQQEDLEGRLAAAKAKASPETQPAGAAVEAKAEAPKRESALDRKDKMVKLEAHLRELEDARKKAPTPEAKKAIEQQLEDSTKEWEALKNEWTPEDEAEYQEAQAEKAKQEQVLALEGRMRELEQQYKEATDPDKKAAIARDLEATTREWDALRAKPVSKKGAPKRATKAIEGAAALVAAAETMAAAAETIADTTEKQAEKKEEMDKAKEAEKSALGKIGGYAGEHYTGGGGGGSSGGGGGYGGGGGGGKEKGALGKKLEAAWDWAQKFFGGWTGVK